MKFKVYQMTSPRSGNPVANQYEIRARINKKTKVYFQSYNTIICEVEEGGNIVLDKNYWDYSRTTLKYLKQFLSDFIGWTSTPLLRVKIQMGQIKLRDLNR